jgi:hypothetical protein
MVQRRECLRLAAETGESVGIGSDGRRQDLEGDVALEPASRAR